MPDDPFENPPAARKYDDELRASRREAARETRQRAAAQSAQARQDYEDEQARRRPRRAPTARQAPSGPSHTRLPTVSAQDAERTMAWQLVVMWALMLANDLAPGPTGRGGTARGQAMPKPRQFLAAALVWIGLSFPAQAKNRSIQHAAILLGWLIVLAYSMKLLMDNPGILVWLSNISGAPNDLFPPKQDRAWNPTTIAGYSGGLTPAQAAAQVPAGAAALQQAYGMDPATAQAYASQLSQSLQYPYSG